MTEQKENTCDYFNHYFHGSQKFYSIEAACGNKNKIFMDNYGYTEGVEYIRQHMKPETFEKFTTALISQVTYYHPFLAATLFVDGDDLPGNNYAALEITDGNDNHLLSIALSKDELDPGVYKFFVNNYMIMAANEW